MEEGKDKLWPIILLDESDVRLGIPAIEAADVAANEIWEQRLNAVSEFAALAEDAWTAVSDLKASEGLVWLE